MSSPKRLERTEEEFKIKNKTKQKTKETKNNACFWIRSCCQKVDYWDNDDI